VFVAHVSPCSENPASAAAEDFLRMTSGGSGLICGEHGK